jgi:hypothetical protein
LGIEHGDSDQPLVADACFENVVNDVEPLRVVARCKDEHALGIAQEILHSIKIKDSK